MRLKLYLMIILILITGIFYYNLTGYYLYESNIQTRQAIVTRIIDGDTIETSIGTIRLKSINTPEKAQPKQHYEQAKNYLTLLQNQTITIEVHSIDQYSRLLGYVYYQNKNINQIILENGLAHLYLYNQETDSYSKQLEKTETRARQNQLGIWRPSPYSTCLKLLNLKHTEPESIQIQNTCNIELNIIIKDDSASHIYKETIQPNSIFTKDFSHIFNNRR